MFESTKQLIFANKALCQAEDVEVVLGKPFKRLSSVLQYLRELSSQLILLPPPREVLEEPGRSIERVQKLGAKPYDGSSNPEAALLWLDRVNRIYGVIGCTNDQRVLFSSFLMEDRTKDWWDVMDRRYPEGISWDQFQQEFTNRFFPQSHKDLKIEEFFRLE